MTERSGDPVVGIVMGSDSDWPVMEPAALALEEFGVPYEAHVVSAHRTPHRMLDYAEGAAGRGLRVIIAGAGGAAHLPGMVAAATPLPVVGVPRSLSRLDGMDSLLSIVQMPAGVPVATVSIDGSAMPGCSPSGSSPPRTTPCGRRSVMAVTDPEKGANGISAFVVHRDDPGFAVGPKERKMGIKGSLGQPGRPLIASSRNGASVRANCPVMWSRS